MNLTAVNTSFKVVMNLNRLTATSGKYFIASDILLKADSNSTPFKRVPINIYANDFLLHYNIENTTAL